MVAGGKYRVGYGGQESRSNPHKQLHVGAEECQEVFFWGGGGDTHLLWLSGDPSPSPIHFKMIFLLEFLYFFQKKTGRKDG